MVRFEGEDARSSRMLFKKSLINVSGITGIAPEHRKKQEISGIVVAFSC
jgi:hypothetical protein